MRKLETEVAERIEREEAAILLKVAAVGAK